MRIKDYSFINGKLIRSKVNSVVLSNSSMIFGLILIINFFSLNSRNSNYAIKNILEEEVISDV